MKTAICPQDLPSSLLYEKNTPDNTSTIAYNLELPPYVRGLFFARDTKQGDYQWPNVTNRLLPWPFEQLSDLVKPGYPGIPSNGAPSVLGDALLLQQKNGEYLFLKAVSGKNSLSWFVMEKNGEPRLLVSTMGKDCLARKVPLLALQKGANPYQLMEEAAQSLMADREASSLKHRNRKNYFEAFEYLGWCTWEHYHFDIDEAKIIKDMKEIEQSNIPVRYVLIDDGHIANRALQKLTSFTPDSRKFPDQWRNIMAMKKEEKIKWIGLWYALSGYWEGIAAENDFPASIKQSLYPHNGTMLPGPEGKKINAFYEYYVKTLKDFGFDFLKIDNQAFTLPLYMGKTKVVRQAIDCNLALEDQMQRHKMGLMNCMAQNVVNTDHTTYSAATRVSIDYKKLNENMARSHLFQSYVNTLLLGPTVWPDHDMFHSSDTVCGPLMARSKAVSGGPVYLSDIPSTFVGENIWPLIDDKGRLFRPVAPAVPAPESILTNPMMEGRDYRVFAPTGEEALTIICYNLNVSPRHKTVRSFIDKSDYKLCDTFRNNAPQSNEGILLFDWKKKTAEKLTGKKEINLTGFTDELFHLCPIRNGWAVVGIEEKFLSPATVQIISSTPAQLKIKVFCPGTLRVWAETKEKRELRSIVIDSPREISLDK